MENTAIKSQEKFNNRPTYRMPIDLFNECECGRHEAVAIYKGKQKFCTDCLEGIVEVRIL
jgi:hypothetical protein